MIHVADRLGGNVEILVGGHRPPDLELGHCQLRGICNRTVWLRPVVCAVLGCALSLFSETATEPVPPKWLHDGKLIAEDFSFSIDSPNPDSRWTFTRLPDIQGSKQAAFIVEPSTDTKYLITVSDKGGYMGSTKSFIVEMQKSMPKDWRVDRAKIEPSALPLKDSSKLTITIHLPNEATLYVYGYVVSGSNRTYMLLNYSPETAEPPQFKHFVGSFALLSLPKVKKRS
jgi:hypothetical protein